MCGQYRFAERKRPEPQVVNVAHARQSEQCARDHFWIERVRCALHERKKGVAENEQRAAHHQDAEQEGADWIHQLPLVLREMIRLD